MAARRQFYCVLNSNLIIGSKIHLKSKAFIMKIVLSTIFSAFLLSSCYSYKIFPKEYRSFTYTGERKEAFILNPGLTKEFQILKKAGIFKIVSDTLNEPVVKIKLHPLQRSFVCGQPVTASLFTLGQFPVLLPDRYQYEFDEIQPSDTIKRHYELKIATRFWFWDMFAVKKNFKRKAGQSLLAEYYND
jgi:hypothetical protein